MGCGKGEKRGEGRREGRGEERRGEKRGEVRRGVEEVGEDGVIDMCTSLQALEAIEQAIKDKASRAELAKLCSTFYTIIPHAFGRSTPPVIADAETLQKKFDMLVVLGDIEVAQGMQQGQEKKEQKVGGA